MQLIINGQTREFADLSAASTVADLIALLDLKGDRIAVEHNGSIVSRQDWPNTPVRASDKFEIVHFVGGGTAT